jgi:hypothetical protein
MVNHSRPLETAFAHFRSRRMRLFEETFRISGRTRVLDVGGSLAIWQFASVLPEITVLNLPTALAPAGARCDQVAGDGRWLPFRDRAFDIVFSNSVIEHVGTREDQSRFAAEISRVGRAYWVQTPNRYFPIEMHLMLPLIHFLPKPLQRRLVYRFTGWEKVVHPTTAQRRFYLEHFLCELNLLDQTSLRALFPDAKILRERVLGMAKSLIAVRT